MIKLVTSNSIIIDFLSKYPESLQQACAEALLLYGIRTVKSKFPYGLTPPQLFSVSGLPTDNEKPLGSIQTPPVPRTFAEIINRSAEITERLQKSGEMSERLQKIEENWTSFKGNPGKKMKNKGFERKEDGFNAGLGIVALAEEFLSKGYASYVTRLRS